MKRVLAFHDLCGLGHSSLACALPVISACGHQVIAAPTSVLSSQTDGYENYAVTGLTHFLHAALRHWEREGLQVEALYSGYLADPLQVAHVEFGIKRLLRPGGTVLVDPVLGDNGSLYPDFGPEMIEAMKNLIRQADIVTPNVTELCALTGRPLGDDLTEAALKEAVLTLADQGPKRIVVTSFTPTDDEIASCAYDLAQDRFFLHRQKRIPAHYCGTGDLFASVLLGGLLSGLPFDEALMRADRFVAEAIALGMNQEVPRREGVPFESLLGKLV
ncbi:MAG: pyridoxamine kinase [Clostridia bacterium]|nr:pyridoxamine kinase [Peptococcus niger]MDU7244684.1 pyridoxamine kinase [Clostridiales bacterium]MDU7504821.1 pyridoxamine kinase [Clostridia bacterium]